MAKIMIVDDEQDTVALMKILLEKAGFDISVAFSGEECLEKLALEQPDLILLDIILPGMSGWDVLKEIRKAEDFHGTKVIFVSVKPSEEFEEARLLRHQYSDYITKPLIIRT